MHKNKIQTVHACWRQSYFTGNRGFTLLELLVTSCIAALLMVGVLQVVAHLGLDQARMARQERTEVPAPLLELLRKDLNRAVNLDAADPARPIVLEGYGALDQATLKPNGRSARIVYRIAQLADGPWLIRQQLMLDDPLAQAWTEPVAAGVKAIVLIPESPTSQPSPLRDGQDDSADPLVLKANGSGGIQGVGALSHRIPTRVTVQLEWSDASREAIAQHWVHWVLH